MPEPNVLYVTNGSPSYMPPLRIGGQQAEMGPNMPDSDPGGGLMRRHLEAGDIPPDRLQERLPAGFAPDITFIQASSYRCAKPVGLHSLPGRKILVIADLHHGTAPVTSMLRYVEQEDFDGVIVTHGAHFVHWFEEQQLCPAAMIPNFNVAGHQAPFQALREPTILFIGQAGDFHPRRRHLLNAIKNAGLPLIEGQAEPQDAARLYGQAQVVFNCSLNGDINMRVFEVLAAGGCLVTDRLARQVGLDGLFEDGRHLAMYDGEDDLILLLKRLLANPAQALGLAEAGWRHYWANHSPEIRKRQLLAFADGCARRTKPPASDLLDRADVFERLQEAQRQLLSPTDFMIDPVLPEILAQDAAGLHLLRRIPWDGTFNQPGILLAHDGTSLVAGNEQTVVRYPPSHQDLRLPPS